ncbi:MAG: hypothetical protein BMS9Abin12_2042 [Acidimicrobiia bacterium]|nr:MAG: hypothetical protein BMS9Abin12_2042 [Acidimicrobiia bacterium]
MKRDAEHEIFWSVADEFIATGQVEEGTMMGHHCLRSTKGGGFVATIERSSGDLVVKLPRTRVGELIESDEGREFAPEGKVFREWVAVSAERTDQWPSLIEESIAFVGTND